MYTCTTHTDRILYSHCVVSSISFKLLGVTYRQIETQTVTLIITNVILTAVGNLHILNPSDFTADVKYHATYYHCETRK